MARKKKILNTEIEPTSDKSVTRDFATKEPYVQPYVKARVKTGDSFIRLPNRMLVVDNGWIVASRDEYHQLVKMGVC